MARIVQFLCSADVRALHAPAQLSCVELQGMIDATELVNACCFGGVAWLLMR